MEVFRDQSVRGVHYGRQLCIVFSLRGSVAAEIGDVQHLSVRADERGLCVFDPFDFKHVHDHGHLLYSLWIQDFYSVQGNLPALNLHGLNLEFESMETELRFKN